MLFVRRTPLIAYDHRSPVTNPLAAWQNLQPDGGSDQLFFQFCDALEVKDGVNASAEGWGLDYALQAWGSWWQDVYIPGCTPTPLLLCPYLTQLLHL